MSSGFFRPFAENSRGGESFATMEGVTPSASAPSTSTSSASVVSRFSDALNRKLFDLPRLSPSHELPNRSIFRSKVIRWLWGLWSRRLASGGRYFFLATGLFFGYGATSLEFQAFVPLAYALVVWFLALVSLAFERPRVLLRAFHAPRVAAGETVAVNLEIEGQKRILSGDGAVLPHRLPPEIEVVPATGATLPALRQGEIARVEFELRPEKRGVYALRGYRVQTDFPFGLINSWRVFESQSSLVVYPKFDPFDRLELPAGRRYQSGGAAFATSRGESVEYIGNRDYREGDAVRDIDWRATARLSRPIVREYREEYFLRAAILLDTHVPDASTVRCADFERAVSLGAACGDYLNRADYLVDMLAAGPQLHHLQAGRGLLSLEQILDILARVEADAAEPWSALAEKLNANLESISSVMAIFLDWDEARRSFATSLLEAGAAVRVVVMREGPTTLDVRGTWPGEIVVLGDKEWRGGVRQL